MKAETSRKQSVTVCDVDGVVFVYTRGNKRAGATLRPVLEVALGIAGNRQFSRRTRRSVQSYNLFFVDSE